METLVSIIVPVYNCEKYLEKCLESIVNQSYRELEILVVNDGSTDDSQKIIDRFRKCDHRLVSLYQDNSGVVAARNNALDRANGKYYLFIDGDDYIGVDYVKDLVVSAELNQSDLTICGYTLVYPDNKNKHTEIIPNTYIKDVKEEWPYRISSVCSRLYSSSFWNENGIHFIEERDARAEDVPIAIFSNCMADNICVIKKADYFYVQHEGSAMHSKAKVKFLFPYKAFEEMYLKVKKMGIRNSKIFYDIGILKLFAQFEYVLYKDADEEEKEKFHGYICRLLKDDFGDMQSEWKQYQRKIDLPIAHKFAISLFCRKINKYFDNIENIIEH